MADILFAILSLSAFGSVLAGLILILRSLIKNKVSKALLYYLWLVVLLNLCLPFGISLFIPAGWIEGEASIITDTVLESPVNNSGQQMQAQVSITQTQQGIEAEAVPNNDAASMSVYDILSDNGSIKAALASWLKSPVFWLIILALGAVFSLAWHIVGYNRFAGIIRQTATRPDEDDLTVFREFPESSRVRFIQSQYVQTPMLVGFVHPTVVTPCISYSKSGMADYLRDILMHELTHYRRKDILYKWIALIVTCLHWFNPLMILVRREINRACELSCDEAVIRYLDAKQKQHYGQTLLSMASRQTYPLGILSTTMCEEKDIFKERLLLIMNYKPKTRTALALSLALLLVFTGCAAVNGVGKAETDPADISMEPALLEDVTLYEKFGLTIAIPNGIIDRLIVITEPEWEMYKGTYLLTVYEKRSYEAAQAVYPEGYAGYIFSIARYTQAQYEQFLCSDGSGQSFFAQDDTYYYGWFIPTDVQFYFEGNLDTESDDYKSWIELKEKCTEVREDFIIRNNLTAYSDSDFWIREYTYDSGHIFLSYYPYYAYNGSREQVWTLILSQPATRGDTGIWCVERWKDQHGYVYPYFPDGNGSPSKEYYTTLQAECDAGNNMAFLMPEEAALAFVKSVFDHIPATLGSFERIDNPAVPYELFAVSTGSIHDYMPKLLSGETVSDYELLPCLENIARNIWHEFDETYGRNTDWWNPLWKALNDAAVSDSQPYGIDQALRDYYIGKAYLASDGAYAEGLSYIVMQQWKLDRALYSACLNERFSADEAAAMRLHLTYSISLEEGMFSLYIPDSKRSICLDAYPIEFPFGCGLAEESRETFRAESFGNCIVVEADGLQVTYLNPYDGVYTVTLLRTDKKGYAMEGIAVGDTEEHLLTNWPYKFRKLDSISYDDEDWFGNDYESAYAYTPKESTKSVLFLVKDGTVSGIEIVDGLDGWMY